MGGKMHYKDNIAYRQKLLQKTCEGYHCSQEEKMWCITNPVYNELYDAPRLQRDIIQLKPNQKYQVKATLENLNRQDGSIIPIIGVVAGKGEIIPTNEIFDTDQFTSDKKSTKILGVLINSIHPQATFTFTSKLGLMSVAYQCEYFDHKTRLCKREMSDGANLSFAMIKNQISDNKITYACKSPCSTSFEALVFSLEWFEQS